MGLFLGSGVALGVYLSSYATFLGQANVKSPKFYTGNVNSEEIIFSAFPESCGANFGVSGINRSFWTNLEKPLELNFDFNVKFVVYGSVDTTTTPEALGVEFGYKDKNNNTIKLSKGVVNLSNVAGQTTLTVGASVPSPIKAKQFYYEFERKCVSCQYFIENCKTKAELVEK